jgi:hypothetical protein
MVSIPDPTIDRPFIVLTETKSSYRHIPVWARYSMGFYSFLALALARVVGRG